MARHLKPILQVVLLLNALLPTTVVTRAQPQRDSQPVGLSGYVLAPDGTPVSDGRVAIQSPGIGGSSTSIERTGRFRLIPSLPGVYQLSVTVSDLAPYRVSVTVPPSRTLRLPVIRLSPATYFRARFVTAAGEPILAPRLNRVSMSVHTFPSWDARDQIESDGTITIGPLPRGITMLALDSSPFAQTRLPELQVTGAETLLDGGTVVIQPGAVLLVDVIDETGAPVPQHVVSLEDVRSPSPFVFPPPPRTNQEGRVTFDRLSAGRYRLRAGAKGDCGNRRLWIARLVSVPGSGTLLTRLVVGGHATFRLTSDGAPSRGTSISALPDAGPSSPPAIVRGPSNFPPGVGRPMGPSPFEIPCGGTTDGDGRVTLDNFPPGPARLDVQLRNSTYVRRVNVPDDGRELTIVIPDGFLAVRVTAAAGNQPVAAATLTWIGGGARVEATAAANGEALLEGVGRDGGILTITARGYQPAEVKLAEPPGVLQEVALLPAPVTSLRPRVVTASGEPVPNAVVELSSENPIAVGHVAVTDAKGFVSFSDVPPGPLRLVASADRFVTAGVRISEDSRTGIVLTLSPGHRVIASVELPAEAGPHHVRVVNEAGTSMDGFLDIASDRSIEPPARISLGPLAPGNYVVELHGPREQRQERIRVVDRDVHATFR
jgi:Carboxypeptidase regulatory-like domain